MTKKKEAKARTTPAKEVSGTTSFVDEMRKLADETEAQLTADRSSAITKVATAAGLTEEETKALFNRG